MSDVKHTSGPWTIVEDKGHDFGNGDVDHGGFRIDADGVEQLAFVWRDSKRFGAGKEPFGAREAEANARLIAAAPDHALLLSAMVAGRIRVEPLGSGVEICDGGLRYATSLDEDGCPIVNSAIRAAITRATRAGGE